MIKKRKRINKNLKCTKTFRIQISITFFKTHYALTKMIIKHILLRSWKKRNSEQNYGTEDPEMAGRKRTSTERVMG
jgi:hypothetical protein